MSDTLKIGNKEISNRLFVGTGKFPNKDTLRRVLKETKAELVTVALRRVDIESKGENILDYIPKSCTLITNTSGARDAKEAIRIARLARAMGCGDWIKLEAIADNKYLLPDSIETLRATEVLAKEGFIVLPYMSPDLSIAKRLVDAGAAAIMPLGSPIGSKRGIKTEELIKILIKEIKVPIIVDAGIGYPSEASLCMELGSDAVLVNTAIATAKDPVAMAIGFDLATKAGRLAFLNATQPENPIASASSPLTGFLYNKDKG